MPRKANVIYLYDGSFEGLLCCVYESVYCHEIPLNILPQDEAEISLFEQRYVCADAEKARRVYDSIPRRMTRSAQELVQCVFLSCAKEKEMMILLFLLAGYGQGPRIMQMVSSPVVKPLLDAQLSLKNEVHLLLGFVRFSDYGGVLVASITPKNYVLPFLRPHFCSRFGAEEFLIYDRTHGAALVWQQRQASIVSLEKLELPPEDATEQYYRALWKRFYDTIAIAARENPKCRMTHMPKRYWENLCEMQPALKAANRPECFAVAPANQTQTDQLDAPNEVAHPASAADAMGLDAATWPMRTGTPAAMSDDAEPEGMLKERALSEQMQTVSFLRMPPELQPLDAHVGEGPAVPLKQGTLTAVRSGRGEEREWK